MKLVTSSCESVCAALNERRTEHDEVERGLALRVAVEQPGRRTPAAARHAGERTPMIARVGAVGRAFVGRITYGTLELDARSSKPPMPTGRPATSRRRSPSSSGGHTARASATRRCSARPGPARRRRWPGSSSRSRSRRSLIAHNKTLAAQLCNELREFFPDNAVEYFVSYYDYYQPEAYVPQADLYIEKDSSQNDDIARLRLAATSALLHAPRRGRRRLGLVHLRPRLAGGVARSGSILLAIGEEHDRDLVLRKLIDSQYARNDTVLGRGRFRVKGDVVEMQPANHGDRVPDLVLRRRGGADHALRPAHRRGLRASSSNLAIWPATEYVTSKPTIERAVRARSGTSSSEQVKLFEVRGQDARGAPDPAAHRVRPRDDAGARLLQRDRELLADPRGPRRRARTRSRCSTTSRTTSSSSSTSRTRPCRSSAACTRATARASRRWSTTASGSRRRSTTGRCASTSSSARCRSWCSSRRRPGPFELRHSTRIAEQLIRPTGIVDPEVELRATKNQIDDLLNEIRRREEVGERVLVTTLTKKMAEDLTDYLLESGVKARYLHSEIDTLERIQIIRELRLGEYDVLVGVNLLREGLDLPEVSLVAILDADKEGFLRGKTALIQTIGRAARNVNGKVLMYADKHTEAIKLRARRDRPAARQAARLQRGARDHARVDRQGRLRHRRVPLARVADCPGPAAARAAPRSRAWRRRSWRSSSIQLEEEMFAAAEELRFEYAAKLRDEIKDLRRELLAAAEVRAA